MRSGPNVTRPSLELRAQRHAWPPSWLRGWSRPTGSKPRTSACAPLSRSAGDRLVFRAIDRPPLRRRGFDVCTSDSRVCSETRPLVGVAFEARGRQLVANGGRLDSRPLRARVALWRGVPATALER